MLASFNNPIQFLVTIIAFLVAITVHEFSHAYASDRLGDPTAKIMGRLTLNPLAHLDLVGTLMLLFAPFGWAKPVPFDPFNLRHPRRDSAIISLAGPTANILTAILFSILLHFLTIFFPFPVLFYLLTFIIILNVNLAIFNLVPIYPLDGFHIVEGILPEKYAREWEQLKSLGMIMIIVLVFPLFGSSPVLSLIQPIIGAILNILIPSIPII